MDWWWLLARHAMAFRIFCAWITTTIAKLQFPSTMNPVGGMNIVAVMPQKKTFKIILTQRYLVRSSSTFFPFSRQSCSSNSWTTQQSWQIGSVRNSTTPAIIKTNRLFIAMRASIYIHIQIWTKQNNKNGKQRLSAMQYVYYLCFKFIEFFVVAVDRTRARDFHRFVCMCMCLYIWVLLFSFFRLYSFIHSRCSDGSFTKKSSEQTNS